MKGISVSLLMVLLPFLGFTYDLATDLEKINKAYAQTQSYTFDVSYLLYSSHIDQKPVERKKGRVKKKGKFQYSLFPGQEYIANDSEVCMINHESKFVFIKKFSPKENAVSSELLSGIPLYLKLCTKVKYQRLDGNLVKYTLWFTNRQFSKVEITFDTNHYFLHRIAIFYSGETTLEGSSKKAAPRLEIVCDNFNFHPALLDSDFSCARFLKRRMGEYILTEPFKHYELINEE